jgi:predicted N-acetyltransferase YhbS
METAVQLRAEDTGTGVVIAPETLAHAASVLGVAAAAFGPGRLAKTSERVRENGAQLLRGYSRVALCGEEVVGCCQMWRVWIGTEPMVFLGPLAVHPGQQGRGLGQMLVSACVDAARVAGETAVVLVGAPGFFAPLGFVQVPAGLITLPGSVDPRRLLWLPLCGPQTLTAGRLSGFPGASQT